MGAQHTGLCEASAETDGHGCVGAHSNPLNAVGKKVQNPVVGGIWQSKV